MGTSFAQKIKNVSRLTQIVNVFARYGFNRELATSKLVGLVSPGTGAQGEISNEEVRARRIRAAFEELGPTFVKLGQLLASREDILSETLLRELRHLQDNARPLPAGTLQEILEREYGERWRDIFPTLEEEPLGSASIGQVHRAVLASGDAVVLKIQRPGVAETIRADLSILMGLAGALESIVTELRLLRPRVLLEELRRSLLGELDYFREAASTARMHQLFRGNADIVIPKVYRELSTRHVLVLEAIDGRKLSQVQPEDARALVRAGVGAFLDMTFQFGLFHADLHPGNFLVTPQGKLAILDFGLTARLTRETRSTMSFLLLALVREDFETFARLFLDLTEVGPGEIRDRAGLEQAVRECADVALGAPLRDLQLGSLLMQVARLSARHHAPVSRDLVVFFRGLIALESFGKSLDPGYVLLDEAALYAKNLSHGSWFNKAFLEEESLLLVRDTQVLLREIPLTLRLLTKRLQGGSLTIKVEAEGLEHLGRQVDRASNRISLSFLLGSIVLASSILTYGKQGVVFDLLSGLGLVGFGAAGIVGIWMAIGILRSGRFQ